MIHVSEFAGCHGQPGQHFCRLEVDDLEVPVGRYLGRAVGAAAREVHGLELGLGTERSKRIS